MNYIPKVSVIMPVYNGEDYLREAIDSILNQTFKDFEFIIINDGSTDQTLSILKSYQKKDSRIRLISRENQGLIYSLNEAVKISQGKYIARMDADDISIYSRLEDQISLMEREALDICGCHYLVINEKGKYLDCIFTPLNKDSLLLYLITSVPFAHGSVMMRKSFLLRHNLFYDEGASYAEDKALWIKFYEKGGKFGNVDKILFKYRDFNKSLSKIRSREILRDDIRLKKNFIKRNTSYLETSLQNCLNNLDELSNRELQHLSDTLLIAYLTEKRFGYLQLFNKTQVKFKCLATIKLIRDLIR